MEGNKSQSYIAFASDSLGDATESSEALKTLRKLHGSLPHFKDGRINYTNSRTAVVVTVFVMHKGKILLLKRSQKVLSYRGKWHALGGYVDRLVPIESVALKEVREELGIRKADIARVNAGTTHVLTDRSANKKWIINPFVVELKSKPKIKLDWEHTEFTWVAPKGLKAKGTVPGLSKAFEYANK